MEGKSKSQQQGAQQLLGGGQVLRQGGAVMRRCNCRTWWGGDAQMQPTCLFAAAAAATAARCSLKPCKDGWPSTDMHCTLQQQLTALRAALPADLQPRAADALVKVGGDHAAHAVPAGRGGWGGLP